ncbi:MULTISPECIES: hypothetical protein [Chryseobacterium]|uniref:Activator of Hsp90 ATPase-like protein n=1 Tax=Chryseobacterium geocarposphaerae TaxID=1416776 RepID=A0ABU1L9B0_9FLAO|nr:MULTISPECIES: hypothetical protein [Chryseobacterium]MDR6403301.1 hypothetical protein [Chryseobacterium geocarposphaerae]MDR6696855.1 hypothetical protein [Chryseobacterium ginsenosidimutans]
MAEYQAKSINSLYFEVTNNDKLIGKLIYKNWFKFSAEIEILNSKYQIEPKGFWGTTVELRDGGNVLLKFTMNWNGDIVVHTYFNNIEKDYVFKYRGIFKDSFALTDEHGTELLIMKPNFKWNSLNYEYQITTTDAFENFSQKGTLLINSLHCANYYMSMMMSAM